MHRYLCAVLCAILVAMASLGSAHAQSVPFPDMSENVASCQSPTRPGYCELQPMQYVDKPPNSSACPGYPCAGGPGRYQEVRIINPPGSQFPYFVWTFVFVPDDITIELTGPSFTKALPAGPVLPQIISTKQGRYPYPSASVGYKLDGGAFQWFATDRDGNFRFNFEPPSRQTGTFHITAACWSGCVNQAEKDIVVAGCDICQGKGNPIAPGTGEKLQSESDWQDASAHPLSVNRHFRSQGAAASDLGPNWSHDYAASIAGASLDRIVQLGSGMRVTFHRSGITKPWASDTGSDTLADGATGPVFTRGSDEARYQFDAAGVLQSITQRNGWVMTLGYTGARLTRVTNAFGRNLLLSYDASGRLVGITPPGSAAISYGYDSMGRLASARYPDGTGRAYVYENPSWPNALTGIVNEAGYRYASFGYDDWGRATLTQHDGGIDAYAATYLANRSAVLTADALDPSIYRDKVRVTTPLGLTQYYEYQGGDGTVRLVSSSSKESSDDIYSRVTGERNLPVSETDFEGNVKTFEWDTTRKLLASSTSASNKPEAKTTATQWHATLRLPVLVTEAGKLTAYTYDALANKLSEAITDTALNQTRTTRWTYAATGLV
jgi:YD repeat-containing protein